MFRSINNQAKEKSMKGHLFFCNDNVKRWCIRLDGEKWHVTVTTNGLRSCVITDGCDKSCITTEKIPPDVIKKVTRFISRTKNPRSMARARLRTRHL